jgi:hypothetical protein
MKDEASTDGILRPPCESQKPFKPCKQDPCVLKTQQSVTTIKNAESAHLLSQEEVMLCRDLRSCVSKKLSLVSKFTKTRLKFLFSWGCETLCWQVTVTYPKCTARTSWHIRASTKYLLLYESPKRHQNPTPGPVPPSPAPSAASFSVSLTLLLLYCFTVMLQADGPTALPSACDTGAHSSINQTTWIWAQLYNVRGPLWATSDVLCTTQVRRWSVL